MFNIPFASVSFKIDKLPDESAVVAKMSRVHLDFPKIINLSEISTQLGLKELVFWANNVRLYYPLRKKETIFDFSFEKSEIDKSIMDFYINVSKGYRGFLEEGKVKKVIFYYRG
ncbi:MAG: hypothetical protein ACK5JF_00805 [Oscillospiraceae bacterium]